LLPGGLRSSDVRLLEDFGIVAGRDGAKRRVL
jgi:hypothetical protein